MCVCLCLWCVCACVLFVLVQVHAWHSACVEVRRQSWVPDLAFYLFEKGCLICHYVSQGSWLGSFSLYFPVEPWNYRCPCFLVGSEYLNSLSHLSGFLIGKNDFEFLMPLLWPLMLLDYGFASSQSVFWCYDGAKVFLLDKPSLSWATHFQSWPGFLKDSACIQRDSSICEWMFYDGKQYVLVTWRYLWLPRKEPP